MGHGMLFYQVIIIIAVIICYLELTSRFMPWSCEWRYYMDNSRERMNIREWQNNGGSEEDRDKAAEDKNALRAFNNAFLEWARDKTSNKLNEKSEEMPQLKPFKSTDEDYKRWQQCFLNITAPLLSNVTGMWLNLPSSIKICEKIWDKRIKINDYRNYGETKRHVLPLKNESTTLLTFGVGRDTTAEEKLIPFLHNESKLFGADPVYEENAEMFRKIGTFFNFGLGPESGLHEETVLEGHKYKTKVVPVIDLSYFITDILKRKYLDAMWIDAEGVEYNLFSYFYEGGAFHQKDIVVCQFNMEIHEPKTDERTQKIHDFLLRLTREGRYAIFRPAKLYQMLRIYLFNFGEQICLDRYIMPA